MKIKAKLLQQLVLYDYRYIFAFSCIILFSIFFLGWRLWNLPPGLASAEITTAVRHIDLQSIVNLPINPLHSLLQWVSMELFGVNPASLRLPSVIIAAGSIYLMYQLLKKWFGKPTALLSSLLIVSSDWFLFIGRLGVGSIEFTFWLTLAFLALTKLISRQSWWLLPFTFSLAMLLFVPFGIYAVVVLVASLLGFTVLRARLVDINVTPKIISGVIAFIGLSVFVTVSFINHEFLKNIIGISAGLPSVTEYIRNVIINTSGSVALLPDNNPLIGPTGLLYVRFFELIFILFGLAMLWRTRVNRLNLTVIILSVTLALASGLSSGSRGGSIMLLPAAIYLTAGIRYLIHRWQRTFPKNPYARMAAFVPIVALLALVIFTHYQMYFHIWSKQTETRLTFSKGYTLLEAELGRKDGQCVIVGAPANFRTLAEKSKPKCILSFQDTIPPTLEEGMRVIVASRNVIQSPIENTSLTPLVDDLKETSIHWWVIEPK